MTRQRSDIKSRRGEIQGLFLCQRYEKGEPMKISAGATESQFILHAGISDAHEVVANSLSKLGGVKSSIPGKIKGWGKYGLNKVSVDISFVEQGSETLMTINAKNGSVYSGPNKSLITRLVDAIANSDNATFVPDKQGIGTGPLIASLFGFTLILIIVIPYLINILL
jgi:hypothetical protein